MRKNEMNEQGPKFGSQLTYDEPHVLVTKCKRQHSPSPEN